MCILGTVISFFFVTLHCNFFSSKLSLFHFSFILEVARHRRDRKKIFLYFTWCPDSDLQRNPPCRRCIERHSDGAPRRGGGCVGRRRRAPRRRRGVVIASQAYTHLERCTAGTLNYIETKLISLKVLSTAGSLLTIGAWALWVFFLVFGSECLP